VDSLNLLESNLRALLAEYQALQQQLLALQTENEQQRDEIMRSHAELVKLKADYNHLETAHALLAETIDPEQRDKVRQRINNLIAQIDRALEALKQ
jgi:phage shock protein A